MLRKSFVLVVFIALAALSAKAATVKIVDLKRGVGLLGSVDDWDKVDSLKIIGTMKPNDFKFIRQMLREGRLSGIDLSEADFYFKTLPDSAFCLYDTYDYVHTPPDNPLRYVTLMDGLEYIGNAAFLYCKHLQEIHIPETVKEIGEFAYLRCEEAGGDLNIPSGVTVIRKSTFEGCGCNSVSLPAGLELLDEYALAHMSNLTSLTLPETLREIDLFSLQGNRSLKSIYCLSATPPGVQYHWYVLLTSLMDNATLYVPIGSLGSYKTAYGWGSFKNIVEIDMSTGIRDPLLNPQDDDYYGLDGSRVATPGKGIYIRGGKKFVK